MSSTTRKFTALYIYGFSGRVFYLREFPYNAVETECRWKTSVIERKKNRIRRARMCLKVSQNCYQILNLQGRRRWGFFETGVGLLLNRKFLPFESIQVLYLLRWRHRHQIRFLAAPIRTASTRFAFLPSIVHIWKGKKNSRNTSQLDHGATPMYHFHCVPIKVVCLKWWPLFAKWSKQQRNM